MLVTCDRYVVFSGYIGFLRVQHNWPQQYDWNTFEINVWKSQWGNHDEQSRYTDNTGNKTQNEDKQSEKHNTEN